MRMPLAVTLLTSFFFCSANASIITSSSDPALSGATVADFNAYASQAFSSIDFGDFTISTSGTNLSLTTAGSSYTPPSDMGLGNFPSTSNSGVDFRIDFDFGLDAFGIQVGASNNNNQLTALDINGNIIEDLIIPDQVGLGLPDFSGFYGFSSGSSPIYSILYGNTGGDLVVFDDVTYVAADVPEPSIIALLAAGLCGLGFASRRKQRA